MTSARRLVALALLACLAACGEEPATADWAFHLDADVAPERVRVVVASVLAGGCDGEPIYEAILTSSGGGAMPPLLDPGHYGLHGVARDESCRAIARGCRAVTFPPSSPSYVIVLASTSADVGCPSGACRDGVCDADAPIRPPPIPLQADAGAATPDPIPPPSPCPFERAGRCYHRPADALPWPEAQAHCVDWGGHLATAADAQDNQWLFDQFVDGDRLWIGLHDRDEEGRFTWVDGSPLTFSAWADGQPNDTRGDQDCVALSEDGDWDDRRCDRDHPFVCEAL